MTLERGVVFFSRARRYVGVNPAGMVEAHRPGEHTLIAMVPGGPGRHGPARRAGAHG